MPDLDAVVIGSGAGGLTAALALARAGKKVAVFEQHYLPGGWCHSFTLEGYRFSPGVHYIGELERGGRMRAIYEGLGIGGDLAFCELNPDAYDRVLVGGERFDIPKGRDRFAARLQERFPGEAKGIDGYFSTTQKISDELNRVLEFRGVKDVLTLPFRAPTVARWAFRSAQALIEKHARSPLLRAILAAQCGDHGLPPSLAPAPVHASVAAHYFDGGWYPKGGATSLPRAFIRGLKRAGGELHVRRPVSRILLEKKRAIGVRLEDGTEIRAKHIVSNADPEVTFRTLVGPEHLSAGLRKKLDRTRYSVSALSLFLAVDLDLRAAGLDSGNVWYYENDDVEGIYRHGMTTDTGRIPGLFLTATTLKDPTKPAKGHHTMEAFSFIGYDAFRRWADSRFGERPPDYAEMKRELVDRMLGTIDGIVPGLRKRVVFCELGTPLTNVHYVAATKGNLYGTEKSKWQVGPWGWLVESGIPGLTLCGASTVSHGVLGATLSGLLAARQILGGSVQDLLTARGPEVTLLESEKAGSWAKAGAASRQPSAVGL